MQLSDDRIYDVVQVGYGPVGQANAALLGKRGHSVAVVERQPSLFSLSRAGHIDHEIMRILQSIGCSAALEALAVCPDKYEWLTADGRVLMTFPWLTGISGFRAAYLFYQPDLETALDAVVRSLPNVTVMQGWEAVALDQRADHMAVTVQPKGSVDGPARVVRGRYLIASDGGNSFVRRALGITMRELGYRHGWLVIDFRNKRPLEFPFDNGQICDPRRPASLFEMGHHHHRFSFGALPGETENDLLREDTAWRLVERWITPDDAELIRQAYYTLEAKVADELRHCGNVFLVGDAAHVMPPFLGQGMCSGLRDAANLSWKLDLVLRAVADQTLLDSYTPERQPHAERYVELSMELAKRLCETDPEKARQRDELILAGTAPPLKPFPWIEHGILQTNPPAALEAVIGRLGPQGRIELNGQSGRADDLIGSGWQLLATTDISGRLDEYSRTLINTLNVRTLHFGNDGAKDTEGVYTAFLARNGVEAVLVRPDFYVFGGITPDRDLNGVLRDLGRQLHLI